jgi:hypothetical protein
MACQDGQEYIRIYKKCLEPGKREILSGPEWPSRMGLPANSPGLEPRAIAGLPANLPFERGGKFLFQSAAIKPEEGEPLKKKLFRPDRILIARFSFGRRTLIPSVIIISRMMSTPEGSAVKMGGQDNYQDEQNHQTGDLIEKLKKLIHGKPFK